MEIAGSIDLTHPCSKGGRESVERLSSGVDWGDLLHRVIKAADRQDAAAPASKSEVRATLLRATLVKYEEVMCSIKFVFAPTQAYMYG